MYIKQKLEEVQQIIFQLDNNSTLPINDQLALIDQLEQLVGENPSLIKMQCIALYNAGYAKEAVDYLFQSLKKHLSDYSLYELLFELLRYTDDKVGTYYSLSQMYRLSKSEEDKENILSLLEEVTLNSSMSDSEFKWYTTFFQRESTAADYRSFPIDEYGNSCIRLDSFPSRDPKTNYLTNMYKTLTKIDVNTSDRFQFLYETIRGSFAQKNITLQVKKGDTIAISSSVKQNVTTEILIHNLEETPITITLVSNVIRYIRIMKECEITLSSNYDIFVSHFKKSDLENKPKLVLQIFIDGLSYQFLKENDMEQLMPNTYSFFSKGYINENCHANGEWTLPSLMSMCTGKYTTNHYVYHTLAAHKSEQTNRLIQEPFEEAGYMTARICPNWRGTPSYGYFKSINRFLYSPMIDRMNCQEVVQETLEHMEVFKDYNNYIWMTLEDLHSVADGVTRSPLTDINVKNHYSTNIGADSEISVFRTYNPSKIEEYKATMKRIDFNLGILFDYLTKNYDNNEFIVTLNSDHGQKFIESENYMFSKKRTNVPFMMRGRNILPSISNEVMSNIDIYPTLLNLCDLPCNDDIDGFLLKDFGGEEREYSITESIFPGQTYKLALNDKEHLFTFETKENVTSEATIPVRDFSVNLRNLISGESELDLFPDKIKKYEEIVYQHIKEWIDLN